MLGLQDVRQRAIDYIEFRSTKKHRTRLERRTASRYTAYLERCQHEFKSLHVLDPDIQRAVREFDEQGFTSLWTPDNQRLAESMLRKIQEEERSGVTIWAEDHRYRGEPYTTFPEIEELFKGSLGSFLMGTYRTSFKIFYGVLYRSERLTDRPVGSQLWHDDGGPGTCINVMFYLKDVTKEDGALECLPWGQSFAIFKDAPREIRRRLNAAAREGNVLSRDGAREVKCGYFAEQINRAYASSVGQPVGRAGLVVPFRNNIIHRGGYPVAGRIRYVCVFHCYPSHRPTPFERYRTGGIPKPGSYPKDPAEDF